jgi:predicted transcriptional regulator
MPKIAPLNQFVIHFESEDIPMSKETKKTSLQSTMDQLIELSNADNDPEQLVVTTRIDDLRVFELDTLAKALGQSRSRMASEIISSAISDAYNGYGSRLNLADHATEQGMAEYLKQFNDWRETRGQKVGS